MDNDVVVAIVQAVGAVIAGIAAVAIPLAFSKWRKANEREKEAEEVEVAAVDASAKAMRHVPYRVGKVRQVVTMADSSGIAVFTREIRGIRARDGEKISRIHTQMTAMGRGRFEDENSVIVTHSNIGKGIRVQKTLTNPQKCDITLEIIGELRDSDPDLDVTVTTSMLNLVLLKAVDIDAAYRKDPFKYEYIAEGVDAEVDQLEIMVSFPPGQRPQTWPIVFFRHSEKQATETLKHVPALDESVEGSACLRIVSPPPLFRYAIYWIGLP